MESTNSTGPAPTDSTGPTPFQFFFRTLFYAPPTYNIVKDWKFWVGLLFMILQLSATSCFKEHMKQLARKQRPNFQQLLKWFEVGGIDLMFLSVVQYGGKVSIAVIIGFAVLYNLYWIVDTKRTGEMVKSFQADDVYEDFRSPMCKILTIWLGQAILFAMYIYAIVVSLDCENANYAFWAASLGAVQLTAMFGRGADSQLGRAFRGELWPFLVLKCHRVTICVDKPDKYWDQPRPCIIVMRFIMSYTTNAVMRDVIAYTVPLLLMNGQDTMDFVKDALAVIFITTLDSTGIGGSYTLTEAKVQHHDETATQIVGVRMEQHDQMMASANAVHPLV